MQDSASTQSRPLTAVDLFCGCGGLSLGLERAGFEILHAVDSWKPAVDTYRLNLPHGAFQEVIGWDTALPSADLWAGGPPCQGFSSAGMRASGDARNTTVAVFAHLVARGKPAAFVFENVEGFLTGDRGRWVVDLLQPLIRAGYAIGLRKVNAANYGAPQHRKRVFVVGGLGWFPGFPDPTHRAFGAPGADQVATSAPLCPGVLEAFQGLGPALRDEEDPSGLDHSFRTPSDLDDKRYRALSPGRTMRDLPPDLWHETYRKRAFRRVKDGTPTERRGGPPAGMRRLDPSQPSKAITSGAITELVHPVEHRTLTLRECARLQTFPDDFQLIGSRADKAQMIANAVPPLLAEAVLLNVASRFRDAEMYRAEPGLYEFTPTFASGMSPALHRTVELVHARLHPFVHREDAKQLELFGAAAP